MSATEPTLFDLGQILEPDYAPDLTIQQRYEQWRNLNDWVIPALAALLDDWSAHGGRKVGVKSAVEWLRWHHNRATVGGDFKLDNSFASRMARDLIEQYPHLSQSIETRVLRAA